MQILFCFAGEEDTGADPCEAAGQSQVESVWKTLLQVTFDVNLGSRADLNCALRIQPHFTVFSLSFLCQAAAACVPAVYWDLHTVLCISPSEGYPRELHSFRKGQNHPHPEKTQCVLELWHNCDIFSAITYNCYVL